MSLDRCADTIYGLCFVAGHGFFDAKGKKMEEQRKSRRWHPIYYLRVHDKKTNKLVGRVVDISNEGMCLITKKPLRANRKFQFKMRLPKSTRGAKEFVFDASSVWCAQDINPDYFSAGFRLKNMSQRGRQTIEYLIKDAAFQY